MVDAETFRELALSMPGAVELPHFEKASFRVQKKIFATLDAKNKRACLMLSLVDQSVFSAFDKTVIYPVPNKWGKGGATFVELRSVRKAMLKDALSQAYNKIIEAKPLKKISSDKSKELKDGDLCNVVKGVHAGKSGTVRDVHTSKTGHITITVEQKKGARFKTLARNVVTKKQ